MATDPNGWFLTSQALDHHGTVAALVLAAPESIAYADDPAAVQHLAEHLATELARAGYALVQIEGTATGAVVHDLTEAVNTHLIDPSTEPGFLARTED